MAVRGEFEMELGKKVRKFRFGIMEVRELEKRLGSDPRSFFMDQKGMLTFVSAACWCGMMRTTKGLTPPQVDDWIDDFRAAGGSIDDLGTDLFYAYAQSLGDDGKSLVRYVDNARARLARMKAQEAAEESDSPFPPAPTRELNAPPAPQSSTRESSATSSSESEPSSA